MDVLKEVVNCKLQDRSIFPKSVESKIFGFYFQVFFGRFQVIFFKKAAFTPLSCVQSGLLVVDLRRTLCKIDSKTGLRTSASSSQIHPNSLTPRQTLHLSAVANLGLRGLLSKTYFYLQTLMKFVVFCLQHIPSNFGELCGLYSKNFIQASMKFVAFCLQLLPSNFGELCGHLSKVDF